MKELLDNWWNMEGDDAAEAVIAYAAHIDTVDADRHGIVERLLALYEGRNMGGSGLSSYYRTRSDKPIDLNVFKAATKTAAARVGMNQVKPMFVTQGGTFKEQRKSKVMNKLAVGLFSVTKYYKHARKSLRQSAAYGKGFVKIFEDPEVQGSLKCEPVFLSEILVDPEEAVHGSPRQMFQRKWLTKEELLGSYAPDASDGDLADKINSAVSASTNDHYGRMLESDQVEVVEAWHIGSADNPGKHVIAISGALLFEEDWEFPWFPFAVMEWDEPDRGYWPNGIGADIEPLQIDINETINRIKHALHLASRVKIFVPKGTKFNEQQWRSEDGIFVEYEGPVPPRQEIGTAVSPELSNHLERQWQRAWELTGVSQTAGTAKKEAGLNSGVALREHNDIQSERLWTQSKNWEDMAIQAADIMIQLVRRIAERDGDFSARVPGSDYLDSVSWKDIDMDSDQYEIQVHPASFLPETPAARKQSVQELLSSELLPKEFGLSLLADFPDLKAVVQLQTATFDSIMAQIELLEEGEYEPPEPFQDLPLAMRMVQAAYLKNKAKGMPEELLENFRVYLGDAQELLKTAQQEQMQAEQQAQAAAQPQQPQAALPPGPQA